MKLFSVLLVMFISSVVIAQDVQLIVPAGHSRRVTDVKLSTDGQYLASIDGSNTAIIWDYKSGKEMYHFLATSAITAIDYQNESLLIGTADGQLLSFDPVGSLLFSETISNDPLLHLSVSNIAIYALAGNSVFKLNQSGQILQKIEIKSDGSSLLVTKNQLLVGTQFGEIVVLDTTLQKIQERISLGEKRIGTLVKNQSFFYAGDDAGNIHQINADDFKVNSITPFSLRAYKLATYPSVDKVFAFGRDSKENLQQFGLDLSAMKPSFELPIDREDIRFRFGLRIALFTSDTTILVADYNQTLREFDLKNDQWISREFEGEAAPIYDLAISEDESLLAIASSGNEVQVLDLTGRTNMRTIPTENGGSTAIDFHPVNPVIAVYGENEQMEIYNVLNQQRIMSFKAKGDYRNTPINFDPSGNYLLRKSSESDFDFYNFRRKSPKNLKVKNGIRYAFSKNGRSLIFQTKDGLALYDPVTLKLIKEVSVQNVQDIALSSDDVLAVLLKDDITILFYDILLNNTGKKELNDDLVSDRISWTSNGKALIGYRNSVSRGALPDFMIRLIPIAGEGENFSAHSGFTNSIAFVNDLMLTSSIDGTIKIWDLTKEEKQLGQIIPLAEGQLVVTTPSGLFDATPKAMKTLHYIKEGNVIALDQMKSAYYEPNLLSKLLKLNKEPIRSAAAFSKIGLHPEVKIDHPAKNEGKLGINLHDKGGGIGQVVIMINGKEVSSDVRDVTDIHDGIMNISYELSGHPFLYTDKPNKVSVQAYNEDGTLSSEAKNITVFGEKSDEKSPQLFAIIAGSSDYASDNLDLKFAAKDAHDFANAISLSSEAYLGTENTHVTLLSTDLPKDQWPTKVNILAAFEKYSQKASANDLLLVYISGHGVNKSGENSDFYYLTCAAENGDLQDDLVRSRVAISSSEFTEQIKTIPALKQILVIDACHSGRLAASLGGSRSAVSSTQVRALERMKDRTGLYVLAGSAADAVSYETSLFGQGLLTYSLLFGMKGAALRNDEFIDVIQLFQFAANMVPSLAEDIGGIQQPQVRMPIDAKSFDIGRITNEAKEKINIAEPKPVFVHARFQDESSVFDRLSVSDLVDNQLLEMSNAKEAQMMFLDKKDFSNALTIHGRYSTSGDLITSTVTISKNGDLIQQFEVSAINEKYLAESIVQKVMEYDY